MIAGNNACWLVDEFASNAEQQEFFTVLGEGSPDEVADESESDEQYEKNACTTVALYHVSDADGSLQIKPVGERPLKQSMLDSDVSDRTNLFDVVCA